MYEENAMTKHLLKTKIQPFSFYFH